MNMNVNKQGDNKMDEKIHTQEMQRLWNNNPELVTRLVKDPNLSLEEEVKKHFKITEIDCINNHPYLRNLQLQDSSKAGKELIYFEFDKKEIAQPNIPQPDLISLVEAYTGKLTNPVLTQENITHDNHILLGIYEQVKERTDKNIEYEAFFLGAAASLGTYVLMSAGIIEPVNSSLDEPKILEPLILGLSTSIGRLTIWPVITGLRRYSKIRKTVQEAEQKLTGAAKEFMSLYQATRSIDKRISYQRNLVIKGALQANELDDKGVEYKRNLVSENALQAYRGLY